MCCFTNQPLWYTLFVSYLISQIAAFSRNLIMWILYLSFIPVVIGQRLGIRQITLVSHFMYKSLTVEIKRRFGAVAYRVYATLT
jgi:hypothetical protein